MDWTSLLWFLLVGLVAGWLAGKIMKGKGFGLIGNLVVGVIGAIIGGYVFGLLNISRESTNAVANTIMAIAAALVGALILLWVIRMVKKTN